MHDSLDYLSHESIHRQYHHNQMTFPMMYAYNENFVLPLSHDEVVHGKGSLLGRMPGDRWQKAATLRAYFGFMWAQPGKKLLFMGSEFAQSAEWNDNQSLDWWLTQYPEHDGMQRVVRDINTAYRTTPALWERDCDPLGFEWIDANDSSSNIFTWLRWDEAGRPMAVVCNMAPVTRLDYRLGLPCAGKWSEILNTDADEYGGSGVGNLGEIHAQNVEWHGRPASAQIGVPPLATVWFRYDG